MNKITKIILGLFVLTILIPPYFPFPYPILKI